VASGGGATEFYVMFNMNLQIAAAYTNAFVMHMPNGHALIGFDISTRAENIAGIEQMRCL
jgi:hypothetical protein